MRRLVLACAIVAGCSSRSSTPVVAHAPDAHAAVAAVAPPASMPSPPATEPAPSTAPAGPGLPDGVADALRKRAGAIRNCRQQAMAAEGTITVKFEIDASGAVTEAVATFKPNQALADCVVKVVKGTTFPPGAVRSVEYPFHFVANPQY
jgi:TonB family protein